MQHLNKILALSINQGTLGRKKISANRDLLISDDLISELMSIEHLFQQKIWFALI